MTVEQAMKETAERAGVRDYLREKFDAKPTLIGLHLLRVADRKLDEAIETERGARIAAGLLAGEVG